MLMISYARAFFEVMGNRKLSPEQLAQHKSRRLREVLISAYKHVPYYRRLMNSIGYNPEIDFRGPGDLFHFPVTTKADLKRNDLKSFIKAGVDLARCFSDSTSGSTGIPLTVYRDHYERAIQISKMLRTFFINGYSIHDKVLTVASPARLKNGQSFLRHFGILRWQPINYLLPPGKMVDILLEYKPVVLHGNRSHLDNIALELLRRNIQYKKLKLIVVTAEIIDKHTRRLYKEAFGLEPIETYGSTEVGIIAYETPERNGLKLCDDFFIFEFLDHENKPVAPGEAGRVLVTYLYGKIMPLIRYDQGDLICYQEMPGQDGMRITKVIGRDDDLAVLPDGSTRPFHDFYEIMDQYQQINQFRVVQKTMNLFEILIAAKSSYFDACKKEILDQLHRSFPANCSFKLTRVDSIEPDPSGKLRMLISEVAPLPPR